MTSKVSKGRIRLVLLGCQFFFVFFLSCGSLSDVKNNKNEAKGATTFALANLKNNYYLWSKRIFELNIFRILGAPI